MTNLASDTTTPIQTDAGSLHQRQPAAETGSEHYASTPTLSEKMAALANNYNAPQVVAQLPQLSIEGKNNGTAAAAQAGENTTGALIKGATQTFLHSLIQAPLEGVAQVVDHTVGKPFQTHLYDKSKDLIVAAPEQTTFASAEWHGQAIGGALAMIPLFLASRGALRSTAGALKLTEALVVSEAEAATNSKVFSSIGAKLTLEGGATGAVYSGAFKPVETSGNNSESSYWHAKATTVAGDFASFATLTASSIYLNTALKSFVEPVIARAPTLAPFANRALSFSAGSLSGAPAAVLETSWQYFQNQNKSPGENSTSQDSFARQLGQNIYSYAFVGGALGALHGQPAAPKFVPLELTAELKNLVKLNEFTDERHTGSALSELGNVSKYLLSPSDFRMDNGRSVVGHLPKVFAELGAAERDNLYQLDNLARALRHLDTTEPSDLKFTLGLADGQMTVSRAGQDGSGNIYNLNLGNQNFDFKVAHSPNRLDLQSIYAETAANIYLMQNQAQDVPELYASHPHSSAGWLLRGKQKEAQSEAHSSEQTNKTAAQILIGSGIRIAASENGTGTARGTIDLSRIEPEKVIKPLSLQSLLIQLDMRQRGFSAAENLGSLPAADLKNGLIACLEHAEAQAQVPQVAVRLLTEPGDIAVVLRRALGQIRGNAQAAAVLDRLADTEYFKPLFDQAMLAENSRPEAVKHLDKLAEGDRKAAFDQAFEHPLLRIAATRALDSIADPGQRAAAAALIATDPGATFAHLEQMAQTRPLSESEIKTQQQSLENYLDRFNLSAGHKIADPSATESFGQWLATNQATRDQATGIAGIWAGLNESQRQLSAQKLSVLAELSDRLSPSQWRLLNAEETIDTLNIITRHSIHTALPEAMRKPSFVKWLSKNGSYGGEAIIDAQKLLDHWDQIPQFIKEKDGATMAAVVHVFDSVKPKQWAGVASADLFDTALALKQIKPNYDDATMLVNHSDFAHWYKSHNLAALPDQTAVKSILTAWDKFTPEQKELDFPAQVKLGKFFAANKRLEKVFGADSPVSKYIIALHTDRPEQPLPAVADWYASFIGYPKQTAIAAKILDGLVQANAPLEQFDPLYLNNEAMLQHYYSGKTALMTTLTEAIPDREQLGAALKFIAENDGRNIPLLDALIKEGFTGSPADWNGLTLLTKIHFNLALAPHDEAYLFRLHKQGMRLHDLSAYVSENPGSTNYIVGLITDQAGAQAIDGRRLEDHDSVYRFYDFNAEQLEQLDELRQAGLSTTRLLNHITDRPLESDAIKQLLTQKASPEQFRDFMRLAAFPPRTDLQLVEAISKGQITTADVLAKVRDWQSGRHFRDLLINHVQQGAELSQNALTDLHERAEELAKETPQPRKLQQDESLLAASPEAATFVNALQNILQKIPDQTPIVLLGRDAWPLVPMLRASGREAQYFLWSRLQLSDDSTKAQWLKEIPPHAAVIDTGFSGSILRAIEGIDPTATGHLLSSSSPTRYPNLLSTVDHREQVNRIEQLPKLIYRSSAHTAAGGAVSRRHPGNADNDTGKTLRETSRWYAERRARELLRASGLPDWDVWRYSQFVGLTPAERLGVNTKPAVEAHYQEVAKARQRAAAQ